MLSFQSEELLDSFQVKDNSFPKQTERDRKVIRNSSFFLQILQEALYNIAIDYFDKAKCWELAVPLVKELQKLYEQELYDYAKLTTLLVRWNAFFTHWLSEKRSISIEEYFRSRAFSSCLFPCCILWNGLFSAECKLKPFSSFLKNIFCREENSYSGDQILKD